MFLFRNTSSNTVITLDAGAFVRCLSDVSADPNSDRIRLGIYPVLKLLIDLYVLLHGHIHLYAASRCPWLCNQGVSFFVSFISE